MQGPALNSLQMGGVSPEGARQFLAAEVVTSLSDRHVLAQIAREQLAGGRLGPDAAIHAEKNQDIEVENDETHWVGHDRKLRAGCKINFSESDVR